MINIEITVANEQENFSVNEDELTEKCKRMLEYTVKNNKISSLSVLNSYDLTDKSLAFDVLICDDSTIHELNKSYRNKDSATDVLSFALFADSCEPRFIVDNTISLGEIIISAQTADRQAKENEKIFEEEMDFLLSHGILHLLGFDHPDEGSLEFMLQIQDKMTAEKI